MAHCLQLKANGTRCNAVPLRDGKLCYFHQRDRDRLARLNRALDHKRSTMSQYATPDGLCKSPQMDAPFDDHAAGLFHSLELPQLEDPTSIQVVLTNIVRAIATGQIEGRAAGRILYALHIATMNIKNVRLKPNYDEEYGTLAIQSLPESDFPEVKETVKMVPAGIEAASKADVGTELAESEVGRGLVPHVPPKADVGTPRPRTEKEIQAALALKAFDPQDVAAAARSLAKQMIAKREARKKFNPAKVTAKQMQAAFDSLSG